MDFVKVLQGLGVAPAAGIYLLVMPKYWGKQIFILGSFTKVGQKQKTEKEKERKKSESG